MNGDHLISRFESKLRKKENRLVKFRNPREETSKKRHKKNKHRR